MKKRTLAALLVMLLALGCLSARAERLPEGLFRIVCRDAQGQDTLLGTAVLMEGNTLLTAASVARCDGQLMAVGPAREYPVLAAVIPPEQPGVALLGLAEQPSELPVALAGDMASVSWAALEESGTMACAPVEQASIITLGGQECLLYTAREGLLPGGVLVNEKGELLCLTVASYAEGVGRYVALEASELLTLLPGANDFSTAQPESGQVTGFTVTAEAGVLTVDWSACGVTLEEGEQLTVALYDTGNTFLNGITPSTGETSISQAAVPGRTYEVAVLRSRGEPDFSSSWYNSAVQITLPEAEPFDRYQFRNEELYLGCAPLEQAEEALNQQVEPIDPITAQSLTDPAQAVFLQATSTYQVEKEAAATAVIALFTPENYCFFTEGGFLFLPELCAGDVWNMEITDLIDHYLEFSPTGGMSPGAYSLRFYLDGALAGELMWTLE